MLYFYLHLHKCKFGQSIENVNYVELNISISTVSLNAQILKMI